MTLCIGTICQQDTARPRIIFCSDTKVAGGPASAEIGDKVSFLMERWPALKAGKLARAEELLSTYAMYFRGRRLTELNVLDEFKKPPELQKHKRADELVRGRLGISYEQLLRRGKKEIPRKTRERIFDDIELLTLDCDLIFGGFIRNEPYLFGIDGTEALAIYEEHFYAIGSGAPIANASLFQRKYHCDLDLDLAIYYVYEAKKLGQVNPDVGEATYIDVLRPGKNGRVLVQSMTDEGVEFLYEKFKKFGPQKAEGKIKLERKFFEAL
ncbi:hypothetical protein [Candidatus Binatus sp.]|uniref:hypothetical protein n=1 Tax=Candidatus Binatus sp. TaxID=2811406 RepID=UPI003C75FB98